MAWSKVSSEHKKPFKWWLHKLLCEYGWLVRNKDNYKTYYHHLNMLCNQGFNLYGEKTECASLLEEENDIDTVGKCANCGVEFHIHKSK